MEHHLNNVLQISTLFSCKMIWTIFTAFKIREYLCNLYNTFAVFEMVCVIFFWRRGGGIFLLYEINICCSKYFNMKSDNNKNVLFYSTILSMGGDSVNYLSKHGWRLRCHPKHGWRLWTISPSMGGDWSATPSMGGDWTISPRMSGESVKCYPKHGWRLSELRPQA